MSGVYGIGFIRLLSNTYHMIFGSEDLLSVAFDSIFQSPIHIYIQRYNDFKRDDDEGILAPCILLAYGALSELCQPFFCNLFIQYYVLRCYPKQQQRKLLGYELSCALLYGILVEPLYRYTVSPPTENITLVEFSCLEVLARLFIRLTSFGFYTIPITIPLIYGYLTGHYPIHFKK